MLKTLLTRKKRLTFAQYADVFIKQLDRTRSRNTILSYRQVLSMAAKEWGDRRICGITRTMVKLYISDLSDIYKYSTVCLHFDLLRNAFRAAVEDEVISVSPMQGMKKPMRCKDDTRDVNKAFTEDEVRYILNCMEHEKLMYKCAVYFMVDSGCRRGEVCGLTWDCVDLVTGEVSIRNNAQYFPREGVKILSTKNGKYRKIILNTHALEVMRAWRMEQERWFTLRGMTRTSFCFNNSKGGVINPATLTALFRIWGKTYGIKDFRPHRLRHSMATISIAQGADIVSVSRKIGHSSAAITLNVYSHANEEAQRKSNQALARAIYEE